MKVSTLWLKEFLTLKDTPQTLAQRLTFAGVEVESVTRSGKDILLELAVPPNRGDLLGHDGVARELAAILRLSYKPKKILPPKGTGKIRSRLTVSVKDRVRAPRYMVRMISGIKVGPSPDWLVDRLETLGMRSVNNIVDATNYVMMELGQPLHAFDYDRLREHCLVIQAPPTPMRIKTLDDVEYSLTTEDLCIMDAGGPVAIAGVMGGQNSSVAAETTTIALESAYFLPSSIRRSSRRLGLSSESSRRFERAVDPDTVSRALHRATQLIVELAGGVPSADWIDFYPRKVIPARITFDVKMVTEVLGVEIKTPQIAKYLTSLGCQLRTKGNAKWQVVMPASRPDLTRAIDLVEEVVRLYGYDDIPATLPRLPIRPATESPMRRCIKRVRDLMAGAGFYETVHYGFDLLSSVAWANLKQPIAISNPLGNEPTVLRSELMPAMIRAIAYNLRHRTMQGALFEVRRVFTQASDSRIQEPTHLAMAAFGTRGTLNWTGGKEPLDFFDIKGVIERLAEGVYIPNLRVARGPVPAYVHPGESAQIFAGTQPIGWLGALHPQIAHSLEITVPCYMAELNLDKVLPLFDAAQMKCVPLPKFPGMRRDIALLVDAARNTDEVESVIRKAGGKLLVDLTLFDCYQGKNIPAGKKSLAFALQYQDPGETLTDDVVGRVHDNVVKAVTQQLGAAIR